MNILLVASDSTHSCRIALRYRSSGINFIWKSLYPPSVGKHEKNEIKPVFCGIFHMVREFWKSRGRIIHVHYLGKALIPIFLSVNRNLVINFWGSDFVKLKKYKLFWLLKLIKLLHSKVIFISDANHIISTLKKSGIEVEHVIFGTDTHLFKPKDKFDEIKNKKIISCRNFAPLYRIEDIIKFFVISEIWKDDWELYVYGVGSQVDTTRIHKLCIESNKICNKKVIFLGRQSQEQIVELFQNASFHISAAISDGGLSAAVAEGMACGSVPIINDAVDNSIHVNHDNGVLFLTDNLDSLIDTYKNCAKMTTEDHRKLSNNAVEKINLEFSSDAFMNKIVGIYKRFNDD